MNPQAMAALRVVSMGGYWPYTMTTTERPATKLEASSLSWEELEDAAM